MKKNARQSSEWFQSRLDELGMTQKELAEKSGIIQADVSRYKNQKQLPRITQLDRLAEVLDVNIVELLIGLGAIDPDAPTTPKVKKGKRISRVDWS